MNLTHRTLRLLPWLCLLFLATACQPSPELNVLNYRIARALGVYEAPPAGSPTGRVTGVVLGDGEPLAGATVILAEPRGTPYVGRTAVDGRYDIDGVPPGRYVPAAVAPGHDEAVLRSGDGAPVILDVVAEAVTEAPPLRLQTRQPRQLPADLAAAVDLTLTDAFTATAPFPPGAAAQVFSYQFAYEDATVDTLRVYLPLDAAPDEALPLLFFSYPGHVDGWQDVSVAFADRGYALVALSPVGARGLDIDGQTADAQIALQLALDGALAPHIDASAPAIALGGSFTSAIVQRLVQAEPARFAAWVTLGGIADGFTLAEAFYSGDIQVPPSYALAIPSLGQPNLQPLDILKYSPVYKADHLPPALVIHTSADAILPIEQAYALADALEAAQVPVETFYYDDVSHYLQIGEEMTAEGREMFELVLEFIDRYQQSAKAGVESGVE
jgi:acetyl esterase/lipase